MHNYYKKNNVSLLNNLNSASKLAEYRKKARGRLTSSHLYHYANNNPITYTDPDGKFIVLFGGVLTAGAGVGGVEQRGTY